MNYTVIADYPAYKIVIRDLTNAGYFGGKRVNLPFTDIVDDESLAFKRKTRSGQEYYSQHKPGSVISYALKDKRDPIHALERAKELGHDLHWIIACGSMITAHQRPQETWTLVTEGMLVRFEGRLFKIETAPNDNLKLVPFDIPE